MAYMSVAFLIPDAQKAGAEAALALLIPTNAVTFSRKVCALDPAATWETPATHWYANAAYETVETGAIWQNAVAEAVDPEPLSHLILFTVQPADVFFDFYAWSVLNLGSWDLQLVPDPPW